MSFLLTNPLLRGSLPAHNAVWVLLGLPIHVYVKIL